MEQPSLLYTYDHPVVSALGQYRDFLFLILQQVHIGSGLVICILFCDLYTDLCSHGHQSSVDRGGYSRGCHVVPAVQSRCVL